MAAMRASLALLLLLAGLAAAAHTQGLWSVSITHQQVRVRYRLVFSVSVTGCSGICVVDFVLQMSRKLINNMINNTKFPMANRFIHRSR